MKLLVRVIEATNLPAMDPNGSADPYVKLKVGNQRFKTKVVKKCLNPSWCEEFSFKVEDLKDQLVVSVLNDDKYFNYDFIGSVKIPISRVFDTVDKSLGTVWYQLQPKKKSKMKNCGEILITICFSQNNHMVDLQPQVENGTTTTSSPARSSSSSRMSSPLRSEEAAPIPGPVPVKEEKSNKEKLSSLLSQFFSKSSDSVAPAPDMNKITELPEIPETNNDSDDKTKVEVQSSNFEQLMKRMEEKDEGSEMPGNLPGGVVLDQMYTIAPSELNSILFSPDSNHLKQLAEIQGSTELQVGAWKFESEGGSLKRVVTYVKAPSRLIKAIKAIEDQTYLKADGKSYAVLASVNTPEAPYASNYRVEVLTCISPGPEESSHLVISWRMNFLHNTMMKGMIEGGARQGVKESFEQVANLLAQSLKVVDMKDIGSEKEQVLASLQVEQQSDWKLAVQYFANFTVISTIFMGLYVLVHICLAMPSTIQGLEFGGLDLPDSIGEVVVCGALVLQGERVMLLISRFMQARLQKGGDHGVKALGDGWLLTVALVEGSNLPAAEASGLSDPYVVFTCNGKMRTSSIKFQKSDPRWNEIFEFDAMDDPPSTLDVEVYDFDGPFDEAVSLGRTQINFVKTNISDLGDVWVPLQGKLAQACQSKLHLRIFLNNTRGSNIIKEYLTKMEKEVGKKIKLRSPQTNSAFQKLFKLPPEEFLINDFTCHLKRKMPLQGRLFLSARIIGFHGDLFGHKTNFFFLWEDIEEIQVVPPTLSSMGSPIVVITLHPGRGLDAKYGAKTQDAQGRLKFHFQSFVSFSVAHRTIMALWRARALSPEQKAQIAEEESDDKGLQMLEEESSMKSDEDSENKSLQSEESGSFLGVEDVSLSVVYSSVLSVPSNFVMELFSGSELERRAMERAHCVNYSTSPWEFEKPDVYQRQTYYKFDISVSRYGGEVTTSQQKSRLTDRNGWLIEEVSTLHGVPLGDYFTLHMKYQIEDQASRSMGCCKVVVYFGIAWLKSTKHKKRITKNIHLNLQDRMMIMFSTIEKEFVSGKQQMQTPSTAQPT